MNIEFSQGSHFFHNLTSFQIIYFYLPLRNDFPINWKWIKSLEYITDLKFVAHVKYDKALKTIVDGKTRSGVIKR